MRRTDRRVQVPHAFERSIGYLDAAGARPEDADERQVAPRLLGRPETLERRQVVAAGAAADTGSGIRSGSRTRSTGSPRAGAGEEATEHRLGLRGAVVVVGEDALEIPREPAAAGRWPKNRFERPLTTWCHSSNPVAKPLCSAIHWLALTPTVCHPARRSRSGSSVVHQRLHHRPDPERAAVWSLTKPHVSRQETREHRCVRRDRPARGSVRVLLTCTG